MRQRGSGRWVLAALLLPVLTSARAGAQSSDWPRAQPEEAGLSRDRLEAMEAAVRGGAFPGTTSVAIARHGKLVHEVYFEGGAATLRDTRSATKTVASILVGVALREHQIESVGARLVPLLPPAHAALLGPGEPRKAAITIEDLLTMSAPLECDDWNDASRGNEERMVLVEDWTRFVLELPVRGRLRVGEAVVPPPHGRNFSYCTGGVFVLGEALQAAVGARLDRYARDKLLLPLGIQRAEWVFSPLDQPSAGGGLRLGTTDLLKLAQLYLSGGAWKGLRLVDAAWVRASTTPHARVDDSTEYGYLWWLRSFAGHPAYFMSGNGGNKVVVVPDLDLAVAITSTNYNARGMHQLTDRLLVEHVLRAVERKQ